MVRLATCLFVLATVAAPLASGAGPQPLPAASSISEYVEQIPTSTGAVAAGHGSGTAAKLSPAAKAALARRGGADTAELGKIATDPRYGAPAPAAKPAQPAAAVRTPSRHKTPSTVRTTPAGTKTSAPATTVTSTPPKTVTTTPAATGTTRAPGAEATPGALSAAGSTLTGGVPWKLVLALGLIAVASAALARRRRAP
jgi:hypothetical protein